MEITQEQRDKLGAIFFREDCKYCKKGLIEIRKILKEIDENGK